MTDVGDRWQRLRVELEEQRFTRELIEVPIALVHAGELEPLRADSTLLLAALRARAEELAPMSIGPMHHDVARALVALEAAGIDLGPVLGLVRKMWSPPKPRSKGQAESR